MNGEARFRRPNTPLGDFQRASGVESTRVARVIQRPQTEPVPADELARIHDADDLGVQFHRSGPSAIPEDIILPGEDITDELHLGGRHDVHDADDIGAELTEDPGLVPVEIPLPEKRSLIPDDILEAIAAEEAELLAEEARAEEAAAWEDDGEHESVDDDALEVVSEHADAAEALAALRGAKVLEDFPPEALEMLVAGAARHHLVDRQAAFREGAAGESFYVVERGVMESVRVGADSEVVLMHVQAGEPFGLFGLLASHTRAATVRAIGEASVLEFRAARLDAVVRRFPEVRQQLAVYFKDRLLENFMAVSPLFRNLDAVGRAALISHFEDRKVNPGEVLLSPGEVQNSIALVTSGHVKISKRVSPGKDQILAELHRGQYYGVVSALSGLPTRASIFAPEGATLCMLPQRAFNDFVKGYPVLRTLPARLDEAGEKVERDVFVGDATAMG